MSDVSDRAGGVVILMVIGAIGAMAGLSQFMHPGYALLIILGTSLVYIATIAVVYNTDPLVWTRDRLGAFFDKRTGGN